MGGGIHRIDDAAGNVSTAVRNDGQSIAYLVGDVVKFVEIFS